MRDGQGNRRGRPGGDASGPVTPPVPAEVTEAVRRALQRHGRDDGPLLEILHAVQAELGYVPRSAVRLLAEALNLSPADVYGVVTFYRDFREEPAGQRTVRICRAEACQSLGCEQLVERAITRLGVDLGETTSDGAVTLDQVFCFGNCALGPSVEVDGRLYGRIDPARLDQLLEGGVHA